MGFKEIILFPFNLFWKIVTAPFRLLERIFIRKRAEKLVEEKVMPPPAPSNRKSSYEEVYREMQEEEMKRTQMLKERELYDSQRARDRAELEELGKRLPRMEVPSPPAFYPEEIKHKIKQGGEKMEQKDTSKIVNFISAKYPNINIMTIGAVVDETVAVVGKPQETFSQEELIDMYKILASFKSNIWNVIRAHASAQSPENLKKAVSDLDAINTLTTKIASLLPPHLIPEPRKE